MTITDALTHASPEAAAHALVAAVIRDHGHARMKAILAQMQRQTLDAQETRK